MPGPTYIRLREDTYTFRYVVPADIRPLLGGRREVTKALGTQDKRLALRLARRLASMLDRFTFELEAMAKKDKPEAFVGLTLKLIERAIDGSMRIEGLEMDSDPARAEEDRKSLAQILGTPAKAAAAPSEGKKLSELIADYYADAKLAKRWTLKSQQEHEAIYGQVVEIIGDKPLASLSRKDFTYLKDMLTRLPSNRNKDPRYKGKSALELAGMSIPAEDKLSVSTVNKMLIRTSSLLNFGVLHGALTTNWAEGLTIAKSRREDEEGEAATDEQVRLLKDAVLRGVHGAGDMPWKKFIPLIGAYSGMRLNEIASLHVADLGEVDGISVISVNEVGAGKRLKTLNARRTVPVHDELKRLGLLEHVAAMRKAGATRLWPELPADHNGPGKRASNWFMWWRERVGFKTNFHSLRRSFVGHLRETDVPEDVVADLVGHQRSSRETYGRYASPATVKRLHAALAKLRYGDEPGALPLRLVAGTSQGS